MKNQRSDSCITNSSRCCTWPTCLPFMHAPCGVRRGASSLQCTSHPVMPAGTHPDTPPLLLCCAGVQPVGWAAAGPGHPQPGGSGWGAEHQASQGQVCSADPGTCTLWLHAVLCMWCCRNVFGGSVTAGDAVTDGWHGIQAEDTHSSVLQSHRLTMPLLVPVVA